MPIRRPFTRRTPAAVLFMGLLALLSLASPKVQAGDNDHLVRVTYQVADLVIPRPGVVHFPSAPASGASATATTEGDLIERITSTVEPKSWSEKGGAGTIDYHPLTMGLIIRQTPDVQEQVADLLNSLRRLQDVQVSLEVRFVAADEAAAERLSMSAKDGAEIQSAVPSDSLKKATFLNHGQMVRLLEAAQGDAHINVTQAPKLTLFNGQSSVLDLTEPESFVTGVDFRAAPNGNAIFMPQLEKVPLGLRMTATPVVSADRRFVNVKLHVDLSSLDDPKADVIPIQLPATTPPGADGESPKAFTQLIQCPRVSRSAVDATVAIPDGCTVVVSGLKQNRQVRTESATPVLSEIPYLNRLFTNVSCSRQRECVLMLVTPRIIVPTEDEERQTGFQAEPPCPHLCAPVQYIAPPACKSAEAAALVAKYHQACAEGRSAEATQLAVQALAIDPACFHADGMQVQPCYPPACVTSSPKK